MTIFFVNNTISDRLWAGHQRRKRENKIKGKSFGYGIVTEESEYTNTISARYYKDGSEILIKQEGCNPRKLTPREAARLQGFPESFRIPVSNTQVYRQFGNSVPVKVIEKVAKQMLLHLENDAAEKKKHSKTNQRTVKNTVSFASLKDSVAAVCH